MTLVADDNKDHEDKPSVSTNSLPSIAKIAEENEHLVDDYSAVL